MHYIRAFVGEKGIIDTFGKDWSKANPILLSQGFAMIYLTNKLYKDMEAQVNSKLDIEYNKYFCCFSPSIYELLIQGSRNGKLAYIETDYFGGGGSQSAVLFENASIKIQPQKTETCWDEEKQRYYQKPEGVKAINFVLKELGVYKENEKDEFGSLGLGNYRSMN
jgi:hypothetical protein